MKVLECSSRGDRRFSAIYARVTLFGVTQSTEQHYQGCKRFHTAVSNPKGRKPAYIEINGKEYPTEYLTPYYKILWLKYLDNNRDLVEYAKGFDDFHDMFRGRNTINCQADVIKQYILLGRGSILAEPKACELTEELGGFWL